MKITKARKEFKKKFGQANHFLITALVWISGIKEWLIKSKPDEFSTSWNPVDLDRSADRSRIFILEWFLWKAVDCLDMYIRLLDRKPNLFYDDNNKEKITKLFTSEWNSIYNRYKELSEIFIFNKNNPDRWWIKETSIVLVDMVITWRNNTMHFFSNKEISESSKKFLRNSDNIEFIKDNYSGLIVDNNLLNKIRIWWDLTFKETASLIRAIHDFVRELDEIIIKQIKIEDLCLSLIKDKIKTNLNFKTKYFGFEEIKKQQFVDNFLKMEACIEEDDIKDKIKCFNIKKEELG